MLTTIEGVYRAGVVELVEPPPPVSDNSRVIVTFLNGRELEVSSVILPTKAEAIEHANKRVGTGNASSAEVTRRHEYEWIRLHRDEYAGQYVALDGARLVTHADSLSEVYRLADAAGASHPFIVRIEAKDELPFGGW
jgi:hypothetical protein